MRVDVDAEDADTATGLVALVITVLELLVEALEREAVRRIEAGDLDDEEIERVGRTLQEVEAELDRLKDQEGVADATDRLRRDLDGLVADALSHLDEDDLRTVPTPPTDGRPAATDREGGPE
jgi:hypothetical protein